MRTVTPIGMLTYYVTAGICGLAVGLEVAVLRDSGRVLLSTGLHVVPVALISFVVGFYLGRRGTRRASPWLLGPAVGSLVEAFVGHSLPSVGHLIRYPPRALEGGWVGAWNDLAAQLVFLSVWHTLLTLPIAWIAGRLISGSPVFVRPRAPK